MRIRLILVMLGLLLSIGDAADIALEMPEHPNVWTGGSREDFSSNGGFEVAGAGVFLTCFSACFCKFDLGNIRGIW